MTILYKCVDQFNSSGNLECVALTMLMIMPALLLQKPSVKSKTKDHVEYLTKRLLWWKDGDINSLIREGEAIQKRLKRKKHTKDHKEKVFVRLMLNGKVSAALRWIGKESTSVLEVADDVLQVLKDKHPSATPASEDAILNGPKTKVEDVIYENINSDLIQRCIKQMAGSAGPSGLDTDGWKRILC